MDRSAIIDTSTDPGLEVSMPHFETPPLEEALMRSATGRRAEITKEYLGYTEQLREAQAGKLTVTDGETSHRQKETWHGDSTVTWVLGSSTSCAWLCLYPRR